MADCPTEVSKYAFIQIGLLILYHTFPTFIYLAKKKKKLWEKMGKNEVLVS